MFEFDSLTPSANQVRAVRALAVLERIGNAAARKLLKELAGGAPEAPLTVQAQAALARLGKADPAREEKSPETQWKELASEDSATAYRAIRALAVQPATAVLMRERLKEVFEKDTFNDDPKRVAKLIGDLDNKVFAVREKASNALRNLGPLAVPALRKALKQTADIEAKRRLQELLDAAGKTTPTPAMLRIGRALEALELMGGDEACQALESLKKDVPVKWLHETATASLRRQHRLQR